MQTGDIMSLELDHIFLFVRNEAQARAMMGAAGLRVNYSRAHPGQGTTNICACFEDIFLELLWLDGSPISAESERMTLGARGRGEGSPIGIAWRGDIGDAAEPTVSYAAPFLPSGLSIPVAEQSLDLNIPFLFRAPGGVRPADRGDELVGNRQLPCFGGIANCTILVPNPAAVRRLLAPFLDISVGEGRPGLCFALVDRAGTLAGQVAWHSHDSHTLQ